MLLTYVFGVILLQASSYADNDQLNVTVYYESLCPDSINFITTQLAPVFTDFENYLNVELVPFGKATMKRVNGSWEFKCQHGPSECYGNEIHSCVLYHSSISASVEFINCSMHSDTPNSNVVFETCAQQSNISWETIETCKDSGEASELLAKNGDETHAVIPSISFIPTIIFNNIFNNKMQQLALNNFLKAVCVFLKNVSKHCVSYSVETNEIF